MKMLLVQPPAPRDGLAGNDTFLLEPLALEYISASVKDLCTTRLCDLRIRDDLDAMLQEMRPDLVGLTGYTVDVTNMRRLVPRIRSALPEAKIVIGGHHATVQPEDLLQCRPDYLVRGEGIRAIREIVKAGRDGFTGPIAHPELAVERRGDTVMVTQKDVVPLGEFPLPDRSLVERYRSAYFLYWWKPVASIRASAGCKYRCKFCTLWESYQGRYFTRDPREVVEEIRSLDTEYVLFSDDESFLDQEYMGEIAALLEEQKVRKKYRMLARTDTIVKSKDVIKRWRGIGLEQMFIGVEAITNARLRAMNKGTTTEVNEEAIRFLQEIGVHVVTDFIIHQDFTHEDFQALRRYVRQLGLASAVFTIMTPLPGTRYYKENVHRLIDTEPEHFDVMHTLLPTALPRKEFYREFHRLYQKSGSLLERIRFLSRFSLRDTLDVIRKYGRVSKKLRRLYQ
jgi:radical SAM superfamily enzyme YgiQ (UPF0313 family)